MANLSSIEAPFASLQSSYDTKVQNNLFFQIKDYTSLANAYDNIELSADDKKKIGWDWKVKLLSKSDVLAWSKDSSSLTHYHRLALYFYNFDEITEKIIKHFFDDGVFHAKFANAETINRLHNIEFHFISVAYLAISFDPPEGFVWSDRDICMLKINGIAIPDITIDFESGKVNSPNNSSKGFVFADHLASPQEKLWSLTEINFTRTTWLTIDNNDQLELLVEAFGGEKLAEFVKEQYPRPQWGIAIVSHVGKMLDKNDGPQLVVKDKKVFDFAHDNRAFFERSIPPFFAIPPDWKMDVMRKQNMN